MSSVNVGLAVFQALALPLLLAAGAAAWLYGRAVLLPAWRAGQITVRHHGLPLAIVVSFTGDLLQTVIYGIGRLFPNVWPALYYHYPLLTALRLLVLAAAVLALAAYGAMAGWRCRWPHLVIGALVLWAVAFAVLMGVRG